MSTTTYTQQEHADPAQPVGVRRMGGLANLSNHGASILALVIVAIVFTVDLWLPLGVASAIPYTFAVLVALKSRWRTLALRVAMLCCVLTIAKMVFFPDRGSTELWKVYANRGLAVFSIGMTAFLGLQRRRSEQERQRAEEITRVHLADLAHVGRLKTAGELATGLAHELNQPLAAISLQAEVATRLAQPPLDPGRDALLSSLQEITEQAQRAAAIMRTLRALVRKSEPKRAAVSLNDIVREVIRLMDSQAQRAGVVLHCQLAAEIPPVLGDRIQLGQVLVNLIQNAIEASVEASSSAVQIQTSLQHKDGVTISVCDAGVGLTAAESERVFERFYTTKPAGMGMGLAISRSIVEAHGGRLWAQPNLPCGAVFTLTLPLPKSEAP